MIEFDDDLQVIEDTTQTHVVADETRPMLLVAEPSAVLLVGPQQGPPGVPGLDGNAVASLVQKLAGETLSGHRAVFVDTDNKLYYADPADESARVICGITTGAASAGATASAQFSGVMNEPSWSWTPALPVFLSTNGALSQTPPPSGYLVEVGRALTPTSILIEFSTPIFRS